MMKSLLDIEFYILESIPKDNNRDYSKHESWVSKDKLLIKKENSYDKEGKLLKEKSFESPPNLITGFRSQFSDNSIRLVFIFSKTYLFLVIKKSKKSLLLIL